MIAVFEERIFMGYLVINKRGFTSHKKQNKKSYKPYSLNCAVQPFFKKAWLVEKKQNLLIFPFWTIKAFLHLAWLLYTIFFSFCYQSLLKGNMINDHLHCFMTCPSVNVKFFFWCSFDIKFTNSSTSNRNQHTSLVFLNLQKNI